MVMGVGVSWVQGKGKSCLSLLYENVDSRILSLVP